MVTNACVAAEPPPSNGGTRPPGTVETIVVANLICDSSSPYYTMGGATISEKSRIISAYKLHVNGFGRCPEFMYAGYDGWVYWQNFLTTGQKTIAEVESDIKTAGVSSADVQAVVDAACTDGAKAVYGAGVFASAKYIMGSGNRCDVTF